MAEYKYSNKESLARERNPSDKYGSIRDFGTEERLKAKKKDALKDMALGAAAPVIVPLDAATRDIPNPSGPMSSGVDYIRTRGKAVADAVKDASKFIGGAASRYKSAKEEEESLDRELAAQNRRETRGMKKGGAVKAKAPKVSSASKRADGCAMRGKTKGKIY